MESGYFRTLFPKTVSKQRAMYFLLKSVITRYGIPKNITVTIASSSLKRRLRHIAKACGSPSRVPQFPDLKLMGK